MRHPDQPGKALRQAATADERLRELRGWLRAIPGLAAAEPVPASGDASFRRYFRVAAGASTRIVMDAPPPMEDCRPFVEIAGFLEAMSLNAPRVLEADLERGFLLLTDLGSRQYLPELVANPASADRLYADALAALATMQHAGRRVQHRLPPYDDELLRFELSLFRDWLCGKHLGLEFDAAAERAWRAVCDLLVGNALEQPRVFVHRDYHSRNLMITETNNPGILDFQDAVEGPATYDLVSLLRDCYVRWPDARVRDWVSDFYDRTDENVRAGVDRDRFLRHFDLMGVQRHLKAAGIFARLCHRDGKPDYLKDVPRTLSYIVSLAPEYDELEFLARLIEERCLPRLGAPA